MLIPASVVRAIRISTSLSRLRLVLTSRGLISCAAAIVLLATVPSVHAASFDCAQATSKIDLAICASPRLSALDLEMSRLYKVEQDRLAGVVEAAAEARQKQRDWLRSTRNPCPDDSCMEAAYLRRIADLLEAESAYANAKTMADIEDNATQPSESIVKAQDLSSPIPAPSLASLANEPAPAATSASAASIAPQDLSGTLALTKTEAPVGTSEAASTPQKSTRDSRWKYVLLSMATVLAGIFYFIEKKRKSARGSDSEQDATVPVDASSPTVIPQTAIEAPVDPQHATAIHAPQIAEPAQTGLRPQDPQLYPIVKNAILLAICLPGAYIAIQLSSCDVSKSKSFEEKVDTAINSCEHAFLKAKMKFRGDGTVAVDANYSAYRYPSWARLDKSGNGFVHISASTSLVPAGRAIGTREQKFTRALENAFESTPGNGQNYWRCNVRGWEASLAGMASVQELDELGRTYVRK